MRLDTRVAHFSPIIRTKTSVTFLIPDIRQQPMAVQLRAMDANGNAPDDKVGYVEFSLGEEQTIERSKQWVAARVWLNVPNTRSSAQVQLIAVRTARDLLVAESERLERLHDAERSQP